MALLASPSIPPFSDRLIRDGKIHLARVDGLAIGSYYQSVALERTKNRCFMGKLGPLVEFVAGHDLQVKNCDPLTSQSRLFF